MNPEEEAFTVEPGTDSSTDRRSGSDRIPDFPTLRFEFSGVTKLDEALLLKARQSIACLADMEGVVAHRIEDFRFHLLARGTLYVMEAYVDAVRRKLEDSGFVIIEERG